MSPEQHQAIPSPNIWGDPDAYEIENLAVDPDGAIWAAMRAVRDWRGTRVLDIGCGTGFHLPYLASTATYVIGVEPHLPLYEVATERISGLDHAEVRHGLAQGLPVEDHSIDVVHNRWAYFFGPGCEPGLRELERVMAPGGVAFLIDNDATRSTFGRWFRDAWPDVDAFAVQRFWDRNGFTTVPVMMRWSFESRADLERVVRIEFKPEQSDRILAEHDGLEVDYAVAVRWRRY
ncbi:class I SAM-dependent methyltransferase [Luteipulveratus flavus]|uniref:Class I SAM-dependent methyltransferase n=1 Tax=Luteipulveratus flavus TaxID=3031728 RepID=A0ABT6C6V9_9MICO|nr:class I SAM-dependent methyltransferase [Luteipulveratus sp. YIM 133296]MDF8264676.1 class I SAM-dependent methyltransferase [Luteipulveratus sp. YIM 133296]